MSSNKAWVQSLSNQMIFPLDLKPEAVRFEDIAHALSLKTRFQGQTRSFYSVAQHCCLGARQLPSVFALPFLLHEVSEVYLPDIPGPMKHAIRVQISIDVRVDGTEVFEQITWAQLEDRHADAVLQALGLYSMRSLLDCPEVKEMDWAMLAAEKRDLCGPEPEDWHLPHSPPVGLKTIQPWPSHQAEEEFIWQFNQLVKR